MLLLRAGLCSMRANPVAGTLDKHTTHHTSKDLKMQTCIAQAKVALTPPPLQAASSQRFQDT